MQIKNLANDSNPDYLANTDADITVLRLILQIEDGLERSARTTKPLNLTRAAHLASQLCSEHLASHFHVCDSENGRYIKK